MEVEGEWKKQGCTWGGCRVVVGKATMVGVVDLGNIVGGRDKSRKVAPLLQKGDNRFVG